MTFKKINKAPESIKSRLSKDRKRLKKLKNYADEEEYQKAIDIINNPPKINLEDCSPSQIEMGLFIHKSNISRVYSVWNNDMNYIKANNYIRCHKKYLDILSHPESEILNESSSQSDFSFEIFKDNFCNKYDIKMEDFQEFFLFYTMLFKKYRWIYNTVKDLIGYYIEILKTDLYGKQYFTKRKLLRFKFADGRSLEEHVLDDNVNLDYYKDGANILIYSVTEERKTNNIKMPQIKKFEKLLKFFDARMTIREYEPENDNLSNCRFHGVSLEEIFTDMNTRGYMQGNFKPRYPAKYIKNPIEFQGVLYSSKEKEKNFIKYIESELEKPPQKGVAIKEKAKPVQIFDKFNSNKITYRSSLELLAFNFLDTTPNILAWSSETIIVPYIKPQDKKVHKYFVDLWVMVKQKNGSIQTFLIEIKPKSQCSKPRKTPKKSEKTYLTEILTYATNQAKWAYAKRFAEDNDMKFMIWTEKDLSL